MGRKGFTAAELLAVMAAGGVLMSLASAALVESMRTWRREEAVFSAWSSGERFARDFRRDLRRAVPGGAVPGEEYAHIEFISAIEGSYMVHGRVRYRVEARENGTAAVREQIDEDGVSSYRVYEGVRSFRLERPEETGFLFLLEADLGGGAASIRETIYAPALGGVSR